MVRVAVLVRGVGDVGSAVAHRLFSDGYAVALHDSPRPATTRRRMAFADAVFDGAARLDGVEARLAADLDMVKALMARTMSWRSGSAHFPSCSKRSSPRSWSTPGCENVRSRRSSAAPPRSPSDSAPTLRRGRRATWPSRRAGTRAGM